MADDNDDPPPGIVDPETIQPPSSSASEAVDGASVGEAVVIRSKTSTARLADAGVPTATDGAADLAGLLHARAAVLLGMAEADSVDAASRCPPPPPGAVESWRSLPPAGSAGIRQPPHDIPPLTSTWSARPPPQDEGSACQAFRDEWDDGREEEKREEGEDDKAPLLLEMVAAAFKEARQELIDDDGYAPVTPDMIAASFEAGCGYKEENWN